MGRLGRSRLKVRFQPCRYDILWAGRCCGCLVVVDAALGSKGVGLHLFDKNCSNDYKLIKIIPFKPF